MPSATAQARRDTPRTRRRRRLTRTIIAAALVTMAGAVLVIRPPFEDKAQPTVRRVVVPASAVEILPISTPAPPAPASSPTATRSGTFLVAGGSSAASGPGPLRRFVVEVEDGLGIDPDSFGRAVEVVLWDQRSWGGDGRLAFQRVEAGGAFRVTLAGSDTTRRLCRPLDTGRTLSCYQRGRAVLNVFRWRNGSPYFPDLQTYRAYRMPRSGPLCMINHEVGHALGRDHLPCPWAGQLAPVMMQQTKGLGGCLPNAWPDPA